MTNRNNFFKDFKNFAFCVLKDFNDRLMALKFISDILKFRTLNNLVRRMFNAF